MLQTANKRVSLPCRSIGFASLCIVVASTDVRVRAAEPQVIESLVSDVTQFEMAEEELPKLGIAGGAPPVGATPAGEPGYSLSKRLDKLLHEKVLSEMLHQERFRIDETYPFEFNAGGEIPIIKALDGGGISLEYKNFGSHVRIRGKHLGSDKVQLSIEASRVEIDDDHSVTIGDQKYPGLESRTLAFKVDVERGQNVLLNFGKQGKTGRGKYLLAVVRPL
jgi:hypothetical protein